MRTFNVPANTTVSLAGNIGNGSTANVTKTGNGVLALSGLNASAGNGYVGDTFVNGGLIQFSFLTNWGLGNIHFNGGGAQWAPGVSTDLSQFNIFFDGNATFDTNGNNVNLTNPVGRGGPGNLIKSGNGLLTLSAGSNSGNITGNVIVNAGTTNTMLSGISVSNDLQFGTGAVVHRPAGRHQPPMGARSIFRPI